MDGIIFSKQCYFIKNVLFLIIEYEVVTNSLWNNIINLKPKPNVYRNNIEQSTIENIVIENI